MASSMVPNTVTNTGSRAAARRRKKKRSQVPSAQSQDASNSSSADEWKSEAQQQVYSSRLLGALRMLRLSPPSSPAAPKGGRAVREVADRVLAVTAKGRTRWSREILTNRLKLKFMKKHNKRQRVVAAAAARGNSRLPKKPRLSILRLKMKNLPTVQRKARVLGRIVPGCRKEPLPVILEEATDYIAALEMQVRAMSALADLLSGASSSSSAPPT
ncbi:PREDICTED: transcription factor bHLH147-like [Ipomoea nil]|uniref:transcription factor bHLH147-like n=1 Tax=Ipomoea nil TaxID=35883 RepID=UPI000900EA4F|nr:PREDICTED: transcription factor bHLH147-like [Ipomoea nil]